jgi:hypothetical protein
MIPMTFQKLIDQSARLLLCILLAQSAKAQTKTLRGVVKDAHSDERIPFASMEFQRDKSGRLSD